MNVPDAQNGIPREDILKGENLSENFPITGQRLQRDMIVSIAWIKKACARANLAAGTIRKDVSRAIEQACDEIIAGRLHDQR